jgi:hypothetical protein
MRNTPAKMFAAYIFAPVSDNSEWHIPPLAPFKLN